jgi:hypothetical protein
MNAAPPTKAAWYADGLRWIGSLFDQAADHFDRVTPEAPERPPYLEPDEHISDLRNRINRYWE